MSKIPIAFLNIYFCPMNAKVNSREFLITQHPGKAYSFEVNGKPVELDAFSKHKGTLNILYKNRSYRAELVGYDESEKIATVKLNARQFEVALKDTADTLLEQLGITGKTLKVQNIKAPMPGLVLSINIKEGDMVKKGDGLLVLEAMKMENLIKSHSAGKIKKIHIAKGTKVEKNQPLIEME